MKFRGKLTGVTQDFITRRMNITFTTDAADVADYINEIKDIDLSIEAKKFRKGRSLDANGLLWACLGEIAIALRTDKWSVYLQMLKRYGQYTYIIAKEKAVPAIKAQWRECEEVGETMINGQKGIQLICYFGSSTYDSKEFSVLLDGVISEMIEMGLQPPPTGEMKRVLERMKNQEEKNHG